MGKKTESVKVELDILEMLKGLKEREGINISTAITLAVKEKYGDRLKKEDINK